MKTLRYLSGSLIIKRKDQFILCVVSLSLLQGMLIMDNRIHDRLITKKTLQTSAFMMDDFRKESYVDHDSSLQAPVFADTTRMLDDLLPGHDKDTASDIPFIVPYMPVGWPYCYTFSVSMQGQDEALHHRNRNAYKNPAVEVKVPDLQECNTVGITLPVAGEQVFKTDTTLSDTAKNYDIFVI
jgi:hypothetical protein